MSIYIHTIPSFFIIQMFAWKARKKIDFDSSTLKLRISSTVRSVTFQRTNDVMVGPKGEIIGHASLNYQPQ